MNRIEIFDLINEDAGLWALRDRAAALLSSDPGHDLSHCLRVALWTIRLKTDAVTARHAIAAALCHDLINVPKNSPQRSQASHLSAEATRALLAEHGFSPADIEDIAIAVRDHSYSRGAIPTTPLGRALQDADRLDAMGAIGIFRTISVGVQMGARFFDPEDPWAASRQLDDRAFSVDHFFTKLLRLPETMCTADGRVEAVRRTRIMLDMLDALAEELGRPRTT